MRDYCIWVVSPQGYVHSHAFDEAALCLNCAFREIGYDVPIVRDVKRLTNYPIVLGCNLIPSLGSVKIPNTSILYNMEQIQVDSPWMTKDYLALLRSYEVWDYSKKNIAELENLGIKNVKFCGLGYVPEMTSIKSAKNDIDILLYGSLNERRLGILRKLRDMGVSIQVLFGVYGEQRDYYISRSKIVLNIHFYEAKVLEVVRVYYLLANRQFVISEQGNDQELERLFHGGVAFAPYENLVEECMKHLKEDSLRTEIAETGFSQIQSLTQVQFLKEVLEQ